MLDQTTVSFGAAVLECHPLAAVLVKPDGKIAIANRPGSETLAREDGLAVVDGQIQCTCREASRRLARLILADAHAPIELRSMRVPRSNDGGAWLVGVKALYPTNQRDAMRLVSWLDPAEPLPLKQELIEALFGLSRSEGRVAARLAHGSDLQGTACALGIQQETVKAHLKAIFRKMGIHRQQQLVRIATMLGLFC